MLNITQQIASSIGVAVMSVILTNGLKNAKLGGAAIQSRRDPGIAQQLGPSGIKTGLANAAHAFAHTYWVAFALVLVTVVATLFLPRKQEESHLLDDDQAEAVPVIVH